MRAKALKRRVSDENRENGPKKTPELKSPGVVFHSQAERGR
jgi:hypothetical protein